jgi:hypothetical protein
MNFSFEFLNIHITHLAQLPMINMTLKWHHISICNKIAICFGHLTSFLARLTMITYFILFHGPYFIHYGFWVDVREQEIDMDHPCDIFKLYGICTLFMTKF